jgi:integrase
MKCIREVKRKNGVAFAVQIRLKGAPPLRATFDTMSKAKKFVKDKKAIVTTGGKWNSAKIENTTLEDIFDDFIKSNKVVSRTEDGEEVITYTKKLSKHKEHLINFLSYELGALKLSELTHDKIARFFADLLVTPIPPRPNKKKTNKLFDGDANKCYSEPTVNKYFGLLRQVCEDFAFKHNLELGKRFTKHVSYQNWRPRELRISPEAEKLIYSACATKTIKEQAVQYKQLFELAMQTGMRASELMRLQAKNCHIGLSQRYIHVARETNKLKKSRSVPLSLKAIEVLTANLEKKTPADIKNGVLVFDKLPKIGLDLRIKEIMYAAGYKELRLSDFRHEFLCRTLEQTSIDIGKLALATGHNLNTLLVYAQKFRSHSMANELDQKE